VTSILVSGAQDHVAEVAEALRTRGAEVTEVGDLADVPGVCAAAGPRAFDSYVQLPASFRVTGDSAILRVHHFYAEGVLARFTALAAALPSLTREARITFVLGRLPPEAATPDDREARRALTRVLTHAARADAADGRLMVRVLDAGAAATEIAHVALGLDPTKQALMDRAAELSYADWRVELLGLVAIET
jgi:hypothetical protein